MFLFTIVFLALAYVIAFAKQQNYFRSDNNMGAFRIMIFESILYLVNQRLKDEPFVNFNFFKNSSVLHGSVMLLMLGFFLTGSSLQSKITIGILGFDSVMDNSFNLWTIPGLLIAIVYSMKWLIKEKSLKIYIITGFSALLF